MISKISEKKTFFKKIIDLNLKEFDNKKYDTNNIILVEFNSFHITHIIFAYIANYFKKKNKLKIKAFYSHILLSYSIHRSIKQKIYSFFGEKFNKGFFGIYKSFGVEEFIFPKISKDIKKKTEIEIQKILSQIKNKKSILNIHIDKILVGDLIYDSYLTRNNQQKATIDFTNPDFISFLHDFILLFFAWKNIFKKNDINVIITSHSIYTMGIPVRLALKKKAIALEVKEDKIKRLNNTNLTQFFETKNYPKIFKKLKTIEKKVFIKKAEKKLNLRFKGSNEDLPYVTKSAFQKNFKSKKIKIKKNKKKGIKVLILSHDFIDAPHCAGNFVFSDMYEWIKYLAKKSKEKNYQWFLKTHPNMGGKYKWYQDFTRNNIKELISGSNIKFLNPNTSHNQILQHGVDFVLTVFGTAGHEYAYKNIKVINASNNNPHSAYKFNIHTNSIKTYDNYLNNLTKVKLNIKKKDVLEYYSMHYLYNSRNWFFKDYNHLVKIVGYHGQWTIKIYKYWIENYRNDFKENFFNKFDFFIKSKDSVFSIKHENKD